MSNSILVGQRYFDPEDCSVYFLMIPKNEEEFYCVSADVLSKNLPEYKIITKDLIRNEMILMLNGESISQTINRVVASGIVKYKLVAYLNNDPQKCSYILSEFYYFPTFENIEESLESSYVSPEEINTIRSGVEVKSTNETFQLIKI